LIELVDKTTVVRCSRFTAIVLAPNILAVITNPAAGYTTPLVPTLLRHHRFLAVLRSHTIVRYFSKPYDVRPEETPHFGHDG
jgi:hypothetical protein